MKVNFSKPGGAPSMVAASPSTTATNAADPVLADAGVAAVPTATGMVVMPAPSLPVGAPTPFSDEDDAFNPGDLVLPRLNIVQKVGDLSTVFAPGTIVLDGQLELVEAPKEQKVGSPIRLVVLGLQPTYFTEKLEGGARGNIFNSEEEVVAAGGTLDWNESQRTDKALYQRVSTGLVLIEQPAGLDAAAFPHCIEGKNYALSLYTMKGVAYTNAARHIKSAKKIGHLRAVGYRGAFWQFSAKLEKYGSNYAYRPVLKAAEATTETLRNEVKNLLGF